MGVGTPKPMGFNTVVWSNELDDLGYLTVSPILGNPQALLDKVMIIHWNRVVTMAPYINYSATPSQLRNCNDIDFTSRFLRRRMRSHLCQAIVSKSSIVSWTDFVEGIQVLFLNGKPMASFPSPSPNMKSALIMAPWRDSILKHQAAGTDRVHDGHSMVGCSPIRMQFASK